MAFWDQYFKEGPSEGKTELMNELLGSYGNYMQKSKDFMGPALGSSMGRNDSATNASNAAVGRAQPQMGSVTNNPFGDTLNKFWNNVGPPNTGRPTPTQEMLKASGKYGVDTLLKNVGGKGLSGGGGFDPNVAGFFNSMSQPLARTFGAGNLSPMMGKIGGVAGENIAKTMNLEAIRNPILGRGMYGKFFMPGMLEGDPYMDIAAPGQLKKLTGWGKLEQPSSVPQPPPNVGGYALSGGTSASPEAIQEFLATVGPTAEAWAPASALGESAGAGIGAGMGGEALGAGATGAELAGLAGTGAEAAAAAGAGAEALAGLGSAAAAVEASEGLAALLAEMAPLMAALAL